MTKKVWYEMPKKLLALVLACIWVFSALRIHSYAADSQKPTTTYDIVVEQQLESENTPAGTYTYKLEPVNADNPMPSGNNGNRVTLTGEAKDTMRITFDKVGQYDYRVGRVNKLGLLDTKEEIYNFTVVVRYDKEGNIYAEGGTCEDETWVPFDGGCVCVYLLTGQIVPPTTKPNPQTPTTKPNPQTPVTRPTYSSGNSSRFAKYVNTEDGTRILFWGSILLIAAVGLIILFVLKRRRRNTEEA